MLEQKTQSCPIGACSLIATFEHLDLSEKAPGRYILTLEAKDAAGNSTSIGRIFTLDPGPPKISLSGMLADRAGLPLNASSGELQIAASEADLPSSGVKKINVELDHQRVATHSFDCSSSCQEVQTSYTYRAQRDGAARSLQAAALPTGSTLTSLNNVSCSTKTDCQAVGYYKNSGGTIVTLAEHWNGASWVAQVTPNPPEALESRLEGVSCTSASSCTAVGYYKTGMEAFSAFAERWSGTTWTLTSLPNPTGFSRAYLYGISCGGASDCWGIGRAAPKVIEELQGKKPTALLEHWDGTAWTQVAVTGAPTQLKGISCPSTTSCMAVSGLAGPVAESWNGTSWASQTLATPSGGSGTKMMGVSCSASNACTVAGSYTVNGHSAPLVERWNGSAWSVQATPDPVGVVEEVTSSNLEGVSCPSASACTAVGVRRTSHETMPLIESWDESEWALQPPAIPSGTENASLISVGCSAPFQCTAVGSHVSTGTQALIEREGGIEGRNHTLTVEAVDRYGNAEGTSIAVDVPETIQSTPNCSQGVKVSPSGKVMTPSEAIASIQASTPTAIAPSLPTTEEISGQKIDPSYSPPKPDLKAEGSLVEEETAVNPQGGITLKGVACISPVETTTAATEAHLVNEDSAVFANSASETETVVRPTAAGATVVQRITGEKAPSTYSWKVSLNANERLVELPSGAAAITRPNGEEAGGVAEVAKPKAAESLASLNDVGAQLEIAEYEHLKANSETKEEVVAVIAHPWVVLRQGSIMPLELKVQPDKVVPTEFTLSYTMPPFESNFIPEDVAWGVSGGKAGGGGFDPLIATVGYCEWRLAGNQTKSPCGSFDASAAASYAEAWSVPPNHDRNPHFPDYKDNNCTNFVSQILGRGGLPFMRAGEAETAIESWWERATGLPEPFGFITSTSWKNADVLPRHLWQYELAVIDPSNEPTGWGKGDILAYNWYPDGKGQFNHLNFVVATQQTPAGREPLIANSSAPDPKNFPHRPYAVVREEIAAEFGREWARVPLTMVHTTANVNEPGAKKHDPANLYGPTGVFRE